jgi:hypothetical protein
MSKVRQQQPPTGNQGWNYFENGDRFPHYVPLGEPDSVETLLTEQYVTDL